MKELPKGKSRLLRITTKNEDQIMDQSNGLQAKISKEKTIITIMMNLQENFLKFTEVSLQSPTSHIKTITRTTEDHMINAQISHSIDMREIGLEMVILTNRMGAGETIEIFLVLHQLKEESSHKINPIANQEVINLTTLSSADLTIDLRLVLRPLNKSFRRTIIRHHLMWFCPPQSMIPLTTVGSLPVELPRSLNPDTDKTGNSRLSLNICYFATGDTQKIVV